MFRPDLRKKAVFKNEADLCKAFISQIPKDWTAFPESAGFDILLVRPADGIQIGVEAKMTLNAKVLLQALEGRDASYSHGEPDFRCALVPAGTASGEMKAISRRLGITVIEMKDREMYMEQQKSHYRDGMKFDPPLPGGRNPWNDERIWVDCLPVKRCKVPEYVPDVRAGASAPMQLSDWKIKAIKICVILEKRGYVTSTDFSRILINKARFVQMGWIKMSDVRGRYIGGPHSLDLRLSHPVNYPQIEADYEKWMGAAKLSINDDPEGLKELPL